MKQTRKTNPPALRTARAPRRWLALALLLLAAALSGCLLFSARPAPTATSTGGSGSTSPAERITSTPVPSETGQATGAPGIQSPTPRRTLTAAPGLTASPSPAGQACALNPVTAEIAAAVEPEPWMAWVRQLSGAEPVTLGGQQVTIETRYTPAMFGADGESGQPNARAFQYVEQTVRGWYPAEQIEIQTFQAHSRGGEEIFGKNLILTLPGRSQPDEVVILTAHLDSTSRDDPERLAPGAEDNASGAAALLEAARLFRERRFERTIRIIWFTGEEQGLLGSRAYVQRLTDPRSVLGVINLDMFGYDSDDDGCFELHVGDLPASERVGRCFAAADAAYTPGQKPFDYLVEDAIGGSDHGPFWARGIGAVEVLENMFDNQLSGGCPNADSNPAYHSPDDTPDKLNPETGARIVRAALASAAALALPVEEP